MSNKLKLRLSLNTGKHLRIIFLYHVETACNFISWHSALSFVLYSLKNLLLKRLELLCGRRANKWNIIKANECWSLESIFEVHEPIFKQTVLCLKSFVFSLQVIVSIFKVLHFLIDWFKLDFLSDSASDCGLPVLKSFPSFFVFLWVFKIIKDSSFVFDLLVHVLFFLLR